MTGVSQTPEGITVTYEQDGTEGTVCGEKLLMSVGRRPVLNGFGLENLNLELTERRNVKVDEHLQTSVPGVYVCGDLNGVSLLAHTAVRRSRSGRQSYSGTERCDQLPCHSRCSLPPNPEIASVGMSEEALQASGVSYRTVKLPDGLFRTFCCRKRRRQRRVQGASGQRIDTLSEYIYLGNPASELIVMAGMMIEDRRKLSEWKRYVFPHPTVGEIFRELI